VMDTVEQVQKDIAVKEEQQKKKEKREKEKKDICNLEKPIRDYIAAQLQGKPWSNTQLLTKAKLQEVHHHLTKATVKLAKLEEWRRAVLHLIQADPNEAQERANKKACRSNRQTRTPSSQWRKRRGEEGYE